MSSRYAMLGLGYSVKRTVSKHFLKTTIYLFLLKVKVKMISTLFDSRLSNYSWL